MQKRKLKICLICDARSIHFKRWIRDLKELGHRVYVISPWEESIKDQEVAVIKTPKAPVPMLKSVKTFLKMLYRIKLAWKLRSRIRSINPDVVHAHFLTDSGWIGAWTGFHPFIVTAHGSDLLIHPQKSLIYRLCVKYVIKRADRILYVARHFEPYLAELTAAREKLQHVPNYVDSNFIVEKEKLAGKVNTLSPKPVIISARMLEPIYDVKTLIHAVPDVIDRYPQARFLIIGDGVEMRELKDLTDQLGVSENVEFTGRIGHLDLIKYFHEGHIYVSTAISDGLSVTTLEGLASGLYPILTDIPANSSIVENNKNGMLFSGGDSVKLSNCIIQAISDASLFYSSCLENRSSIEKLYSRTTVLRTMENAYYGVLESSKNV